MVTFFVGECCQVVVVGMYVGADSIAPKVWPGG